MKLPTFLRKRREPFRLAMKSGPGAGQRTRFILYFVGAAAALASAVTLMVLGAIEKLGLPTRVLVPVWFVVSVGGAFFLLQRMERHANAAAAERKVGLRLDNFERSSCRVVHDFPGVGANGKKFNIDHVLVAPEGVFAIETKYVSKSEGLDPKIEYKADGLYLYGRKMRGDPVAQSLLCASDLQRFLKNKGFNVSVQPVVIIPGWYIEGRGAGRGGPWVLELKAFDKWVEKQPKIFAKEEIQQIHYCLREVAERE